MLTILLVEHLLNSHLERAILKAYHTIRTVVLISLDKSSEVLPHHERESEAVVPRHNCYGHSRCVRKTGMWRCRSAVLICLGGWWGSQRHLLLVVRPPGTS
jgi:hypothetical protein